VRSKSALYNCLVCNRDAPIICVGRLSAILPIILYGDGAGNTVEENSSIFSLI